MEAWEGEKKNRQRGNPSQRERAWWREGISLRGKDAVKRSQGEAEECEWEKTGRGMCV